MMLGAAVTMIMSREGLTVNAESGRPIGSPGHVHHVHGAGPEKKCPALGGALAEGLG